METLNPCDIDLKNVSFKSYYVVWKQYLMIIIQMTDNKV